MQSSPVQTGSVLLATLMICTTGLAQGVYTTNPLVEWVVRQSFEFRIDAQADTASNRHDAAGFLGGLGWGVTDSMSLGIYGYRRGSQRDLPMRWAILRGVGAYAEFDLSPYSRVSPVTGLRLGILSPTGPTAPTSAHVAGSAGIRAALTDHLHLVLAATANWTEDKLLNYRKTGPWTWEADNTDFSVDLGLRYRF